jgi:excisionase family DNA binding protein
MNYKILESLDELKGLVQGKADNRWMDIQEVSDYTSLSVATIRRAIKKGVLKVSKRTGKLLFKVLDVDRWLRNG